MFFLKICYTSLTDIETFWTMILRMTISEVIMTEGQGGLTIIMLQLTRIHTPQLVNKTQRVVSETYQIINEPHKSCLTQWRGKAQQIWYHDHEILCQDYETRHPIGAFPKPDSEKKSKSLRLDMATWRATSRCAVEPQKQTRDCTHAN